MLLHLYNSQRKAERRSLELKFSIFLFLFSSSLWKGLINYRGLNILMLKSSVHLFHRNMDVSLIKKDIWVCMDLNTFVSLRPGLSMPFFNVTVGYPLVISEYCTSIRALLFCNGVVSVKLLMIKQRLKKSPTPTTQKLCIQLGGESSFHCMFRSTFYLCLIISLEKENTYE